MSEMMNKFAVAQENMKNAQKEMRATAKNAFLEAASVIFASHPNLESASWKMYTPYFNDGDECHFCVHEVDTINGVDEYANDDDDVSWQKWMDSPQKEFNDLVESFDSNIMRDVFGDHCKVTVYRDRIEVEAYDHE